MMDASFRKLFLSSVKEWRRPFLFPICINNMPTIGFFPWSMVRAKKSNQRINVAPLPYKRCIISSCLRVGRDEERGRGANSRGTLPSPPLKPTNTTFSLSTLNAMCDIEQKSFTPTLNQCIVKSYCNFHYGTSLWNLLRYNLIGSHYSLSLCSFPEEQFPAVD